MIQPNHLLYHSGSTEIKDALLLKCSQWDVKRTEQNRHAEWNQSAHFETLSLKEGLREKLKPCRLQHLQSDSHWPGICVRPPVPE